MVIHAWSARNRKSTNIFILSYHIYARLLQTKICKVTPYSYYCFKMPNFTWYKYLKVTSCQVCEFDEIRTFLGNNSTSTKPVIIQFFILKHFLRLKQRFLFSSWIKNDKCLDRNLYELNEKYKKKKKIHGDSIFKESCVSKPLKLFPNCHVGQIAEGLTCLCVKHSLLYCICSLIDTIKTRSLQR